MKEASRATIGDDEPTLPAGGAEVAESHTRIRSEAASERRFRAIFHNSSVGIALMDLQGRFVEVNPALERMVGYDVPTLLTMSFWDLLAPAQQPRGDRSIVRLADDPTRHEHKAVRRDGAIIWLRVAVSFTHDDDGEEELAVALVEDVSRELQLEEQYLQAQKMEAIGRLAGGVAHDFNNLLTGILGHISMALDCLEEDHEAFEDVHEIEKAAERAANLTRQLLTFARKQIVVTKVIDPADLVVGLSRMLRRMIGEDIELVVTPAEYMWRIKADAGQLEQVLLNLAVNARDAMPRGGTLSILAENVHVNQALASEHAGLPVGDFVRITVQDTGTGIAEDVMAHIFEPFFTTKGPSKGTGLGLATCFGIVKQNGGHIFVRSEVGEGSAFMVYLPRVDHDRTPVAGIDGPQLHAGSETILLAEDEPRVRQLVVRILKSRGYKVLEAGNGEEALALLDDPSTPAVDLLITDVVMPRVGGRQLAGELEAKGATTRVLFTSGYTDDSIVRNGIQERDIHFIQKPFSPTALLKKVRDVLDH